LPCRQDTHQERLTAIAGQLAEVQGRLHKLYDALETGKLELEDLALRIKDLKGRMNELEKQQRDTRGRMQEAKIEPLGKTKIQACVDDLRVLLSRESLLEQKAFLRSFAKCIKINHPHVVFDYTISLNAQKAEPLSREVLPFVQYGSPGRTRTSDQLVNSQPLYRLSYRGPVPSGCY
jgi:site-specific DNA recombinase